MGGLAHDDKDNNVAMLSRRYLRQSVWLTAGMFIAGLLVMNVLRLDAMLTPLVVSAVFSMVTDTADAMIWRRVAERNPDTAVSGFRMLLALGVMMVCYLVVGRDAMTVFFLVFMSFYVMLLVHHAVFFGKVSNRS